MGQTQAELLFLALKFLKGFGLFDEAVSSMERTIESSPLPLLPQSVAWTPDDLASSALVPSNFAHLLRQFGNVKDTHLHRLIQEFLRCKGKDGGTLLGNGSLSLLSKPPREARRPGLAGVLNFGQYARRAPYQGRMCPSTLNTVGRLREQKRLLGHRAAVDCVLFDKTCQYFFTGSDDSLVKMWRLRDGRLQHTFRGHKGEIVDLSINSTNLMLASGSNDTTVCIWLLEPGNRLGLQLCVLTRHPQGITNVAFSPAHPNLLHTASSDGCSLMWNITGEPNPQCLELSTEPPAVLIGVFHSSGRYLATGHARSLEPREGSVEREQRANVALASGANVAPPAVSSQVCVWMITPVGHGIGVRVEKWRVVDVDLADGVYHTFWAPDGSYRLAVGAYKAGVRLFSWHEGPKGARWAEQPLDVRAQHPGPTGVKKMTKCDTNMFNWSGHAEFVVVAVSVKYERTPMQYDMKVFNSRDGTLLHVLCCHNKEVYVLTPHPQLRNLMLTTGCDGRVILWNLATGKVVKDLTDYRHQGERLEGLFAGDGQYLLISDNVGYMSVYSCAAEGPLRRAHDEQFFARDYIQVILDLHHPFRYQYFGFPNLAAG